MAAASKRTLGTALLYLTSEWGLSAEDAWLIVNPQSRATALDSAGAQGRLLRKWRRTQQPPYCCRDGYELLKDLPIDLLVELQKLRRKSQPRWGDVRIEVEIDLALVAGNFRQVGRLASRAHRDSGLPSYTRTLEQIRMGLDLTVLEKLHGMTRAEAWRALRPQSKAVGASAAAQAQRAIREYRELEALALVELEELEPSSTELSLLAWIQQPAPAPDLLWYARLVTEPHPLQQKIEKRLVREEEEAAARESCPVDPNAHARPSPSAATDTPPAQVVEPQVARQSPVKKPTVRTTWNPVKWKPHGPDGTGRYDR